VTFPVWGEISVGAGQYSKPATSEGEEDE
jgi:hypothetical protein